ELTLTGNKMDEISEIKVGDGICAIDAISRTSELCKCTIPTNPNKGDVDITITVNGTDTYRFARMFEYR
ncbi:MAG: IPT/TIG domain-containing protein, partial [Dysgonamonadaceae bacterium]|nr:IPT/TIG domain-containing protein [Dysgonamonadaceae bacterium]